MEETQLHASCVALNRRGLIILGLPGAGKSALALELMALGARLVADDRVDVRSVRDEIWASPPPVIAGKIEARGLGLLSANYVPSVSVVAVLTLSCEEEKRLPEPHVFTLLSVELPLLYRPKGPVLAAKIIQYMRAIDDLSAK